MAESFELASAFVEIKTNSKTAIRQVNTFATRAKTAFRGVDKAASGLLSGFTGLRGGLVGLAGAAGFGMAAKSLIDFSRQMALVNTMLDSRTRPLLKGMAKDIRFLAAEFGKSTQEISRGLFSILSASIDASKSVEVLRVATELATAGFTDVDTATKAIVSTLNAYGMEAEEAGKVSDIMFATFKRGQLDIGELAANLGNVISTAAIAGVSFEEVGAALATITRKGISAPEAVTALNAAIIQFIKPQDEAAEVAKRFGVELTTNTIKADGLIPTLAKLQNASAREISTIAGGIRGFKAFAAIIGDVDGALKDMTMTSNAAGLTQEALAAATEGVHQDVAKMNAAWKDFGLSVGGLVSGPLTDLIKKLGDTANAMKTVLQLAGGGTPDSFAGAGESPIVRMTNAARAEGDEFGGQGTQTLTKGMIQAAGEVGLALPKRVRFQRKVLEPTDDDAISKEFQRFNKERGVKRVGFGGVAKSEALARIAKRNAGATGFNSPAITVPGDTAFPEGAKSEETITEGFQVPTSFVRRLRKMRAEQSVGESEAFTGEAFGTPDRGIGGVSKQKTKGNESFFSDIANMRKQQESDLLQLRLRAAKDVQGAEEEAIRRKYELERTELDRIFREKAAGASDDEKDVLKRQKDSLVEGLKLNEEYEKNAIPGDVRDIAIKNPFSAIDSGVSAVGVGRGFGMKGEGKPLLAAAERRESILKIIERNTRGGKALVR